MRMIRPVLAPVGLVAALAVSVASVAPVSAQGAAGPPTLLTPHVAVYDLKLTSSRGKRALESVRGRIVYDFSGSVCEGYALKFRQVTELDSGEGKVALSDLRTTTWEEGQAKSFRFKSENYTDDKQVSAVDGNADRGRKTVAVKLTKPGRKTLDVGSVVFPTEHMRRLIEAARADKTLLELDVYDGSENGEKIFQSLAVIGRKIEPEQKKPEDAAAGQSSLAGMARWPVTISYFEKTQKAAGDDQPSEQTPIYAITFEMYENGISRALKLDYGDFVIDGKMSSLEIKPVKACK
jgi:envelope integrity protein B